MTRTSGILLALLLSAAVPASVSAQPKPEQAKKAAPAAKPAPAARPAPAPHAAPAARPAPAPHPVVRAAPPPQRAAPHPVVRAAPRPAPHAAPRPTVRAAPHAAPRPAARATPHAAPRQAARPERRQAPSAARAVQRQERRVQRQEQRQEQRKEQRQELRRTQRQERHAQAAAATSKAAPDKAVTNSATKAAQQATPKDRAATRAERRQERALRRQEDRSVRKLPAAQRAAKREEIRRAREQRAEQRRQAATPNVQAQPNAQLKADRKERRQARRNGRPRVEAQAARRGRFAAAYASAAAAPTKLQRQARRHRWSAREAWRHHARAPFIAWYGPVFWPYAYTDVFDYTFWPEGYDDGYWAYAYDDFVDGLFWGEEGPPAEYAYAPETSTSSSEAPAPVRYAAVSQLCKQPGSGITAWPIAEIEKKVGLNDEQKQLLADMQRDARKAGEAFKDSCPTENAFPLTPTGRLTAMTARLQATLDAVDTVKPSLNRFYDSLSDEQKERFNEIGPKPKSDATTTAQASADTAQSCKDPKPGLANLPIEKIEDTVKPTDAQADELDALQEATDKAVGILQAACPEERPMTPPGRLDAMEARLKAMIEAANTVKPALADFYGSLSNEQKARFNRMGRELASAND